jgi:hypothetical protein
MYDNRRGDDGTTTAGWDICRVAHDFGALASLGEGDDGGHLRREQLLFLVCLYLDENYTAKPQNKTATRDIDKNKTDIGYRSGGYMTPPATAQP